MGVLGCQKMVLEPPFGLPCGYLNVSKLLIEVDETTALWRRLNNRDCDWDVQVLRQTCGDDSSTSSPSDTVEGDSGKDKTIDGSNEKDNAGGSDEEGSEGEGGGGDGSDEDEEGSEGEGGEGGGGDEEGSDDDDEFALLDDEDTENEDTDEDSEVDEEEDIDETSVEELLRLAKEEVKKTGPSSEAEGDTTDGKTDPGSAVNISGEKSISVTPATEKRKIEQADDDGISTTSSSDAKKQKLDE